MLKLTHLCILSLLLLNSCTTTNPTPATLDQVVYNKQSMTKVLRSMSNNLTVTLLSSGTEGSNYVRIVALNLESTPVIAAVSSTSLNNPTFVDILKNSQESSIGNRLFAKGAQISRGDNMDISTVKLEDIHNQILANYLTLLGYAPSQRFIKRSSYFYHKTETMNVIEYILPSLNKFVTH